MMKSMLRMVLFGLIFRPFIWILLGLTIKNKKALPMQGPAILVANHNSHLDTILLMALYPLSHVSYVRPVAAADYFLKNRWLKWFCLNLLQIIPIHRDVLICKSQDPLQVVSEALKQNAIVIYYPEGTRGDSEIIGDFKKGIVHLAKRHPDVPIIPIHLSGLGKVLPKGSSFPVPFHVTAVVGTAINFISEEPFQVTLRENILSLGEVA